MKNLRFCLKEAFSAIQSGHQPLKWLMVFKSVSGALLRWVLYIQAYDI